MHLKERKLARNIILFTAITIGLISIIILVIFQTPIKPLAGKATIVEEGESIGGDFELINHKNEIFSSQNLEGKISLIYFGFSFCPDICPTSLQKLTEVIEVLGKYRIEVNPVFITIDPKRDTPKLLNEYLSHFHPKIIGLTGSIEKIQEVANKYKVFYSKVEMKTSEKNNYMIDHSSFIYLLDKKKKFIKLFYMSSTPEEIIEYIRVNYRN